MQDRFSKILTISLLSSVVLAIIFHIFNIGFDEKIYKILKALFFTPLKYWVFVIVAVAMFSVFFRSPEGKTGKFLLLIGDIIVLYILSTLLASLFTTTIFSLFPFAEIIKPLLLETEVTNFDKKPSEEIPAIILVMIAGLLSSFIFRFFLLSIFAKIAKLLCIFLIKILYHKPLNKIKLIKKLKRQYEVAHKNKNNLDYSLALINFIDQIVFLVLSVILLLAPFAVFASILEILNIRGFKFFADLGKFISFYAIILFSYQFLIMPLFRFIFCFGLKTESYKSFLVKALPVIATAGTTSSSMATLSVNIKAAQSLDVDEDMKNRGHNRALMPIGATFNMDGTSISLIIYFLIAATLSGIDVNIWLVVATAIGLSIGTAAVPSASLIILSSMFSAFAIPTIVASKLLTIILAIDPVHDRIRTIVNTWGDLNMTYIVQSKRGPLSLIRKIFKK